ncbi:hypothetical protein [Spirulina sp. 06S082]|nr:hypothetical protein [Spirulina sp. 06S082]MEA5467616.1 hypothetical protein [Spirulina sp. 06S082]
MGSIVIPVRESKHRANPSNNVDRHFCVFNTQLELNQRRSRDRPWQRY